MDRRVLNDPIDDPIYEYACHEGNYSLTNALRGGQAESARLAAEAQEQR